MLHVLTTSERQIQVQINFIKLASHENLSELQVRLDHDNANWIDKIVVADPVNDSELQIIFWRIVRISEDDQVYHLSTDLEKFSLVNAAQLRENSQECSREIDCLFSMYDRETMYMKFIDEKYKLTSSHIQRSYAIRFYADDINAISDESMQIQSSSTPSFILRSTARTRIEDLQLNEIIDELASVEQDYIVTDAAIHNVNVKSQWLDDIASSLDHVRQFVFVSFDIEKSIES